jgi:hypothetical protein
MSPRAALLAACLATALAGCANGPAVVGGSAGPVTAPTTAASPSRPAPAPRPSGTPTPPAAYGPYALTAHGLTATLPVPADWSLTKTTRGVDFGDPTGTVLLRVEIVTRSAPTARAGWEAAEAGFRTSLPGYQRLGLADVPGVGDTAADLTFTFERDGVTRRVIDRGIVVGDAAMAIYYSAPQAAYDRMAPVFDRASRDLVLG